MIRTTSLRTVYAFILVSSFCVPFSASAGSITANVSASTINSLGSFQVTMTSVGMTSCTWSRLDNGTTWAWQNQPLAGTAYDSGVISGWAGAADYEWQFNCADGTGGSYFGATSISISSDTGSVLESVAESLASMLAAIIAATTNPTASVTPAISVLPSPLEYGDTPTNAPKEIHLIVTNTGGASSLLTGSVTITGDPAFTCKSGCTYTNVLPGPGPEVVIEFKPTTTGPKTAVVEFSGGGGVTVPASGNGVTPPAVVVASPMPVIAVSPSPTLLFYGVEVGGTRYEHFTVTNVGPAGTLLTGTVSVSGDSAFSCHTGCTYTNIGTTGSHNVTMRFHPTGTPGTKLATVTFTGGGNATRFLNGDGYILTITGSLPFGNVPLSQTKTLPLVVSNPSSFTNVGSGTLVVPLPFACIGMCTYSLPPGGSQTFQIIYTPTYPGGHTGNGSLSNYPASSFNFTGNGVREYFRMEEQ